jgi:hypothetical protein
MSGKVSVWPYTDGDSHTVTINSLNFNITPQGIFDNGPTSFLIKSPDGADARTQQELRDGLTKIEKQHVVTLNFEGNDAVVEDIVIERSHDNSTGLGGPYLLSRLPEGRPAKKGGKSVRRHYRKRKSNRRVSNKKYSASRRVRRVRRSRKN